MSKYQEIYDSVKDKEEFIKVARKKYPKLKITSFNRRYYELKKREEKHLKKNKINNLITNLNKDEAILGEKQQPNQIKLLMLDDMKRMGYKITRQSLFKHGFNHDEINWLIINEMV